MASEDAAGDPWKRLGEGPLLTLPVEPEGRWAGAVNGRELNSTFPQQKTSPFSPVRNSWKKLCASNLGSFIYHVHCLLQSLEQDLACNRCLKHAGWNKPPITITIWNFSIKIFMPSKQLGIFLSMSCLQNQQIFLFWKRNIYGMILLCTRCREEIWKAIWR